MARPSFPKTLAEFQRRFSGEAACRGYLTDSRWPDGFHTWLRGTHHGVDKKHLQAYLDEFTFRFNRRQTPMAAFQTLLGLGSRRDTATYYQLCTSESGA